MMDKIIVGSGLEAPAQRAHFLTKVRNISKHALVSYSSTTKLLLIAVVIVAVPSIVIGGRWAVSSVTFQPSSQTGTTPQTTTSTTTTTQSSSTGTQTDATVGGTGTTSTTDSNTPTSTLPAFGTPPPLGSVYHNVFFVGDSITAGWINDGAHAYPILTISGLYSHNTGNAWYQLVKGRSGAISAGALLDLQTFGVQPKNANLVVVELGTNDMVHKSAATFQNDYQSLLTYLITGSPNAQYVCLGPWRAATDNFGYGTTPAYETAIQNVCTNSTNSTARYVDLSALYANKAYHNTTGDTFHPNNAGAQAIANAIVKAVYP